jgi:hypothetical protein
MCTNGRKVGATSSRNTQNARRVGQWRKKFATPALVATASSDSLPKKKAAPRLVAPMLCAPCGSSTPSGLVAQSRLLVPIFF